MRLKPTFVGMSKEKVVAAPAVPATAETDLYHWLDASGYWCLDGDFTNLDHSTIPTDLASLIAWLTDFKASWNAHCAVATGRHHKAADAVNTLSYATPCTNEADCIAALTEIKTGYTAHAALTTTHYFADTTNALTYGTPCADTAACLLAAQEILGKTNSPGVYNSHAGAVASLKNIKLALGMQAVPLQGEDLTAYIVHRKRGGINVSAEMLMEDFRLVNLLKFGDIAPAAETEATSEIQQGSLVVKFTASISGNERSLQIAIPQFDYDPEPADVYGNPEGNEQYIVVGGEASGTAPVCTCTVKNSVTTY